jgi:hypothetical protein
MPAALGADADEPERQPLAGRRSFVVAEGRRWNDGRETGDRGSCASGFQELTAGKGRAGHGFLYLGRRELRGVQ